MRRVLRSPDRWERIVKLAADLGEHLPPEPSARALEEFLTKRRRADPARFPDVSLSVVKLLGSGEYVVELPGQRADGHFGLAVKDYTHSTAPNRRYPDLATQRLLKAAMAGRPSPYGDEELTALARHCTEQEDDAAKVERQVRKSAAAHAAGLEDRRAVRRHRDRRVGERDVGSDLPEPAVEGKLLRGFEGLDVADQVRVELVHTDVERGFVDFVRSGEAAPRLPAPRQSGQVRG